MELTDPEIGILRRVADLCPAEVVGPEGYPDPRPLPAGMPSPAYLWLVAMVAQAMQCDPFLSTWTGKPRGAWGVVEVGGPGAAFSIPDLKSGGEVPQGAGRWTPELREARVRALVRAVERFVLGTS